ncbi:CoA-binding protein [Candidatus Marsarchaeota archaeon]|nr:CoA-binding protein [Candidatus Marsarchaeota archaeon]
MQDPERDKIRKILKEFKVIAVVGCSREQGKPSHDVPMYMKEAGYTIIPVNPFAEEILGEKAYKSLQDIKKKIDVVDVFRPAKEALEIAKAAVEVNAKVLWLQEGIFSKEAREYAEAHGLLFVENRCMMKSKVAIDEEVE